MRRCEECEDWTEGGKRELAPFYTPAQWIVCICEDAHLDSAQNVLAAVSPHGSEITLHAKEKERRLCTG